MPATDPFTAYKIGMEQLLTHLGEQHPRFAEALIYQQRLLENIARTRQYGDTETHRAERATIIAQINALARETGGPICAPDPGSPAPMPPALSPVHQTMTADGGSPISQVHQGVGDQRNIDTGGGDYAERDIDKRQGAFVTESTIHGADEDPFDAATLERLRDE